MAKLRPQFPAVRHPVVRVIPETGRKVLFVNLSFTQRIVGVPEAESNELLTLLYRHVHRPEFQVRLKWRTDTIAFWDNRTCQHYAASDYFPARRVMDRISIVGDRPVALADAGASGADERLDHPSFGGLSARGHAKSINTIRTTHCDS